jgi:hypothetical protein
MYVCIVLLVFWGANARVITCAGLAQSRFFEDPRFLNYLKYLQYWKKPEYAQYIVCVFIYAVQQFTMRVADSIYRYPYCLKYLDLLQVVATLSALTTI